MTCMALILKTLGQAAAAPPGAAVAYAPDMRGRRAGYYEVHETGGALPCVLQRIQPAEVRDNAFLTALPVANALISG